MGKADLKSTECLRRVGCDGLYRSAWRNLIGGVEGHEDCHRGTRFLGFRGKMFLLLFLFGVFSVLLSGACLGFKLKRCETKGAYGPIIVLGQCQVQIQIFFLGLKSPKYN